MNITIEDYLKAIYAIYEKDTEAGVKSADVARQLGISRASVSAMVHRFIDEGYLIADRQARLYLTEQGIKEARKLMHNHRVIEVFLTDFLGHDIKDIHEEAHKLEHAFSQESVKKIDAMLDNPKLSPTGKRIPHKADGLKVEMTTLDNVKAGKTCRIIRVGGKGVLRKRILEMGVVKGAKIELIKLAPLGDPLEIKVRGYSLSLRKEEARKIEVALE